MLCPRCGVAVGDQLTLCGICRAHEAALSAQSHEEADIPLTKVVSDEGVLEPLVGEVEESKKRPPREQASCSEDELARLYRQTIGITDTDEIFQAASHPVCVILATVAAYLFTYAVLAFWAPVLHWYSTALISLSFIFFMMYLYQYFSILFQLFFVDRMAFFLCLGGIVGAPVIAYMYGDELGWRRITIAVCNLVLGIGFLFMASRTCESPEGVLGLYTLIKGEKTFAFPDKRRNPRYYRRLTPETIDELRRELFSRFSSNEE